MKNVLRILGLLLCSFQLQAQDFGSIGSEWYYSDNFGGMGPLHSGYQRFRSVSDTLLLGKTAHKLEVFIYTPQGDTSYRPPLFVYEEADTAYLYSEYKGRFVAIYVFNAQQGDTLTLEYPDPNFGADSIYQLSIDSMSFIQIGGRSLKQFKVSPVGFSGTIENTIIEGIGGKQWLFPVGITIPEIPGPLRCFSNAQIDTNFFSFGCDYSSTASIHEISASFPIKIYPNPAWDQLFIAGPEQVYDLRLRDLQGRLVYEAFGVKGETKIGVGELERGVYLVEVQQPDGKRSVQRLFKQ